MCMMGGCSFAVMCCALLCIAIVSNWCTAACLPPSISLHICPHPFLSPPPMTSVSLTQYAVLLLEELEDIASALCSQGGPNVPDRGWTGDTMQRIGLSCGATVEFFLGYTDKWGSKTSEQRAHLLSSVSHCMTEWRRISMRCALSYSHYV